MLQQANIKYKAAISVYLWIKACNCSWDLEPVGDSIVVS